MASGGAARGPRGPGQARPLGFAEYRAWLEEVVQLDPAGLDAAEEVTITKATDEPSGLELLRKLAAESLPKGAKRKQKGGVPDLSKEDLMLADQGLWGEGRADEILASRFNVELKRSQLECLRPAQWLNDEVINFYFKLLQERTKLPNAARRCWFVNSFFWPKLSGKEHSEYSFKEVRRWTTKAKVDVFDQDYVIFPMNIGEIHWAVGVIDLRECGFRYFDSMYSRPHKNFVAFLRRYLDDEHKAKKGGKSLEGLDSWQLLPHAAPLPMQKNGYDCGVFSCSFAEWFCEGRAFDFAQDDMPNLRLRLAARVMRADEHWE